MAATLLGAIVTAGAAHSMFVLPSVLREARAESERLLAAYSEQETALRLAEMATITARLDSLNARVADLVRMLEERIERIERIEVRASK